MHRNPFILGWMLCGFWDFGYPFTSLPIYLRLSFPSDSLPLNLINNHVLCHPTYYYYYMMMVYNCISTDLPYKSIPNIKKRYYQVLSSLPYWWQQFVMWILPFIMPSCLRDAALWVKTHSLPDPRLENSEVRLNSLDIIFFSCYCTSCAFSLSI